LSSAQLESSRSIERIGVPSAELVNRIESSDAVSAARAAGYRFEARLGAELRDEYLAELAALNGEETAGRLSFLVPAARPFGHATRGRRNRILHGPLGKELEVIEKPKNGNWGRR